MYKCRVPPFANLFAWTRTQSQCFQSTASNSKSEKEIKGFIDNLTTLSAVASAIKLAIKISSTQYATTSEPNFRPPHILFELPPNCIL